jgi:hypothetical protein
MAEPLGHRRLEESILGGSLRESEGNWFFQRGSLNYASLYAGCTSTGRTGDRFMLKRFRFREGGDLGRHFADGLEKSWGETTQNLWGIEVGYQDN